MPWILAVMLTGCFAWSTDSSAGPFVSSVRVERDQLAVTRCELTSSVTNYVTLLGDGKTTKQNAIKLGGCLVERTPLPAGIFPADNLDRSTPPWCEISLSRWRAAAIADRDAARARLQAEVDARRERDRSVCLAERARMRKLADTSAKDLDDRAAIYRAMPDCAMPRQVVPPPAVAPASELQIRTWNDLAPDCRRFTGAVSPGGTP